MGRDELNLVEIIARLRQDHDGDQVVSIMVETGEDEAVLIGTRKAYLSLAARILDCVAEIDEGRAETDTCAGIKVAATTAIGSAFDRLAHVVPDVLYLAADEQKKQRLVAHFDVMR